MLFILLLGVITAFVSLSGGSRAFAEWALRHIKTKRGAKLLRFSLELLYLLMITSIHLQLVKLLDR